jgi:hypothetical protein
VAVTPGGTLQVDSERILHGQVRLLGSDGDAYVRCWSNSMTGIRVDGYKAKVANVTPGAYTVAFEDDGGAASELGSVVIQEGQTTLLAVH